MIDLINNLMGTLVIMVLGVVVLLLSMFAVVLVISFLETILKKKKGKDNE